MTAINGLTTLERVRDWVGVTTNNDDIFLSRLVEEMSRFILSYIQRPTLCSQTFNDIQDGIGGRTLILRHWPVQNVSALSVDNISVPAFSGSGTMGYILEPFDEFPPGRPQALNLKGYIFARGLSNISITYNAGFCIMKEAQQIPQAGNYTLVTQAPYGSFAGDLGVTYANGDPMANVASSPAQGQYTVAGSVYTFSSSDAGAEILVSYNYVPADIEHACMELVGERYRYRNRIGEISKSLGGQETMAYAQKDMPDFIRTLLQPYRRVILV